VCQSRVPETLGAAVRATEPDPADPSEAALRFLIELPRVFAPHAGSTLFQHLLGTFAILTEWDYDRDVRHAGLFHSIYGTEANDIAPLGVACRSELRAVIGVRAESFVYRFHRMRWRRVWPAFGAATVSELGIEPFAIAAANLVEQTRRLSALVPDRAALAAACEPFAAVAPYLPDTAAAALLHEIGRLREQSR
jgi:hypothetical protein